MVNRCFGDQQFPILLCFWSPASQCDHELLCHVDPPVPCFTDLLAANSICSLGDRKEVLELTHFHRPYAYIFPHREL